MKPVKPARHKLDPLRRKAVLDELSSRMRQLVPGAAAVYVFGSFARGEDFADIDVAILMGGKVAGPLELELKLEVRLAKDLNCPVDVRFLEGAPLSFQFAVVRDGRVIVDSEPNRRADFEGIVRKKYFDFSVFRKRYLKEAAHARV